MTKQNKQTKAKSENLMRTLWAQWLCFLAQRYKIYWWKSPFTFASVFILHSINSYMTRVCNWRRCDILWAEFGWRWTLFFIYRQRHRSFIVRSKNLKTLWHQPEYLHLDGKYVWRACAHYSAANSRTIEICINRNRWMHSKWFLVSGMHREEIDYFIYQWWERQWY